MPRLTLLIVLLTASMLLNAEIKFIPGFQFNISTAPVVDRIRVEHPDGRKDALDASGSIGFIFEPGYQFIQERYEVRLSSGIGFLHNNLFNSGYFSLESSLLFPTGTSLSVGPHLGAFYLLSAWDGEDTSSDDVSLEMNQPAYLIGVSITSLGFGTRLIGSLDYVFGEIDVKGHGGWVPDTDHINYQGLSLRMGLGF